MREGSVLASVLDLTLSRGLVDDVEKDDVVGRRVGTVVVVRLLPALACSLLFKNVLDI